MAVTTTPRLGLKTYGSGSDPHPNRDEFNAMIQGLEDQVMRTASGAAAPTDSAPAGTAYLASSTQQLFVRNSSGWVEVAPRGTTAPQPVAPGGTAAVGTSLRSAREDHVHTVPMASPSASGAVTASFYNTVMGAADAATPSRLVVRDSAGRAQFADPAAALDAATKGYVDRALNAQKHAASDITSGVLAPARLPAATASAQGAISAADYSAISGRTSAATASKMVVRDSAGRAQFADPSADLDAATKGYVDSHTWDASAVTTGRLDSARLPDSPTLTGFVTVTSEGRLFQEGGIFQVRNTAASAALTFTDLTIGRRRSDGTNGPMNLVQPNVNAQDDLSYSDVNRATALMTLRGLGAHVATGNVNVTDYGSKVSPSGSGMTFYIGTADVKFGQTFDRVPTIFVHASTTAPGYVISATASDWSTTGCTIRVARVNTTTTLVHWLAVMI